nr:hypothetical protein CFP56_45300 [Quercus suber]
MDEVLSEWKKLSLTAEEGKSPYTTVSSLGDGLGGVTTQTSENKNRAEEESLLVTSQGEPAPEQFSNAQSNVDLPQASHMDTADFMEDLVQISRPTISPIKRGAQWRVGCGDATSVWNDASQPSNVHPRIESQVVTGFEDMKVSTLIDLATKKWDSNMLNGLFITQEAELISSIPLCPSSEGCYCLAFYPIRYLHGEIRYKVPHLYLSSMSTRCVSLT